MSGRRSSNYSQKAKGGHGAKTGTGGNLPEDKGKIAEVRVLKEVDKHQSYLWIFGYVAQACHDTIPLKLGKHPCFVVQYLYKAFGACPKGCIAFSF